MNTTVLTDNFRAAMDLPLVLENEAVLRGALHELMHDLLADPCRKHDMKLQNMLLACKLRLRALQNLHAAQTQVEDVAMWRCDIRTMLEELCAAADLLLSPYGRAVRFEAPPVLVEAACAPRELAALVLELICNAARHTHGEEIAVTIHLKKPRRSRKESACVITVESDGCIALAKLHAGVKQKGSGVSAALRTAWLHHGALLWLAREGKAVAALRLPLKKSGSLPPWEPPDLVELLSDQCSQLYIALTQVCGN